MPDSHEAAERFIGTPEQFAAFMREWHGAGVCDGFNLLSHADLAEIDWLADSIARLRRAPPADGIMLRDRFDLPRPRSRYAL
jgi:alkanesulfonate monooxygenase SsuD/methylene tetrahydromethanopterin reductase-like flavin-dependent oxidoreductase (luciferase family)